MQYARLYRRSRCLVNLLSLLLVLVLLSACGASPGAPPAPLAEVKLQVAWVDNHEYSGFYLAQDKGYYAAEGLKLTILPFDGALSPIDEVAAGRAQFGITSMDRIFQARAEGKPVVAIATIYQRSPIAFISLADKNIQRPQDLVGRTAVIDLDGTTAIAYWALLRSQGIEPEAITTLPRKDFSNTALFDGSADVIDAYINNQPVQLEQQGYKVNAIVPSDYGIDLYSNLIFTSEELIRQKPELIQDFLQASLRGVQEAVDNPEQAVDATVARGKDLKRESEMQSMLRGLPLFRPAGTQPGMMTDDNWNFAHQMMVDQGILSAPINLSEAYTLRFLREIYNQ